MRPIALVVVVAALGGCKDKAPAKDRGPSSADGGATATAVLEARSGSSVKGTVTFRTVSDGVEVTAAIEGLTPGDHAYHVHEKGDCSAPDAESAGGHFNPHGQPHGAPDSSARHAGDFGNLTAGADGKAARTFIMKGVTLVGDAGLGGKGFIVHDKADDLTTQPIGNAGARVACGVIRLDAR